jgi:hypothetical protein
MSPKKETQVEDSPMVENKVEPAKVDAKAEVKVRKSMVQTALPWVIVAVVFFLIGAVLIIFTVYRTARVDLTAAKADAAQLSEKLASTEVDLEKAKTDLSASQASLTDATAALTKSEMMSLLYKFQADVNAARASLLDQDPSSARQFLTFISADLAALQQTTIDAASIAGLQPRIDTALQNLESDPKVAGDALKTLYTNLALITSNYK